MPVEQDDEATTFDPKPWGAMQRILPNSRFAVIRTSGPLQDSSVAAIDPLVMPRPALTVTVALSVARPVARPVPAPMPIPLPLPMAHMPPMPPFMAQVDSTLRVRRTPLTTRSLVAAPIGALFAALVIVITMASGSGKSASAPAASVRMKTVEQPMLPVLTPPQAPAAPPEAAPVQVADDQETEPDEIEMEEISMLDAEPATTPTAKRTGKHRHRPRKIVAVDSSTPLGNLRPRRF